jgi:Fe2+ transport system protein FeoA
MLPLDLLKSGEWAEVAEVIGEADWVCRLAALGLREGCQVQVLQQGSPCLLRVENCKLCLRGAESSSIFVQPLPYGPTHASTY